MVSLHLLLPLKVISLLSAIIVYLFFVLVTGGITPSKLLVFKTYLVLPTLYKNLSHFVYKPE